MLDLKDKRWAEMKGGYRMAFDPRPLLLRLEQGKNTDEVWHELWGELYHQGDVGEATYAAVPHLVRIHEEGNRQDANTYAFVAIVELARGKGKNPQVPAWLQPGYDNAIAKLGEIGVKELPLAKGAEQIQYILALVAIWKGTRVYGEILAENNQEELAYLVERGLKADQM